MACQTLGHQNRMDVTLGGGGAKPLFTDIDAPDMGGDQGQNLGPDKTVMHHHIRPLQGAVSPQRQMQG